MRSAADTPTVAFTICAYSFVSVEGTAPFAFSGTAHARSLQFSGAPVPA